MPSNKTITITRDVAWSGAAMSMTVIIDNLTSVKLRNGESTKVIIPKKAKECEIQVKDHIFKIADVQHVDSIILQYKMVGISCVIQYEDGHYIEALNKNPGATTSNTIWWVILILFVLIPILTNITALIPLMFMY